MDIDGNIIIKPKYDRLKFLSDDILCVNNDGEGKTKRLINIKGENVGKNCFFDISKFENGTALAEIEKHKWVLIDERGNIKKELPEIYQVEGWTTRRIYNNDVDIESYVESLKITKYGLDGISFESEWYPITLYAERTNDKMFGDPQITVSLDQGTLQVTEYAKYCNDVIAHFRIIFPSQGFFTEEYEKGPLHPKILYNYTSSVNQMEYNLDKLYDALYRKISQYGYSVKANKNAVVIKGNGICYMVGRTKDVVCIGMGKVTPDIFDISIYDEN